jgi:hypothetical protein
MTPREAAQLYASIGWKVLPLHTPDADSVCDCGDADKLKPEHATGKHPRTRNGLADASSDPAKIDWWWGMWPHANVAIDLAGSGLVDVAPDGLQWQATFIVNNSDEGIAETLHFASGAGPGHEHHLYARTAECPLYRLTESGVKDVMSSGYCVAPPSRHKSGALYTWQNPKEWEQLVSGPTVPQPKWITDLLRAKQRPLNEATATPHDPGAPPVTLRGDALERWYGRVYDRNPETGALDRSYSLWSIAVALLGAGCSPPFVEQLLAERDQVLGWEKFAGRRDAAVRYRVIVTRAVQSQGPRRAHLSGRVATTARPAKDRHLVEWLTAEQIARMEDEAITWHAYGMLGGGLITELDGAVKRAGKTTLALAMVRCILEETQFLGQSTVYAPIVYLTEQSGPSFKRNLKRAGLLERNDLHVLLWSKAVGLEWEYVVAQAQAHCAEVGAGILIVDTLGQFTGIRGDGENNSGSAMVAMEPLQAAAAAGLAVLVCRHDRKSGGEVGESGRGSSAFTGAADVVLHLLRLQGGAAAGKDRQRLLEGVSRFEETPEKLLVELGPSEPHTYTALGDADVLRDQVLRHELLANLPTNPDDAIDRKALEEAVPGKDEDRWKVLNELIKEGLVRRIGLGKRGDPYRYYQRVWEDPDRAD